MKKFLLYSLLIFVALFISSCDKTELNNISPVSDIESGEIHGTKSNSTGETINNYWLKKGITNEFLKNILGGENKFKACQLPDSVLNTIPTQELADLCITFPLRYDFLLVNNEDVAVKYILENFNGFKELLNRQDGPIEFIIAYKEFSSKTVAEQLTEAYMELALANEVFYDKLSTSNLNVLYSVVEEKLKGRLFGKDTLISQTRINNLYSKMIGSSITRSLDTNVETVSEDDSSGSGLIIRYTPFGKVIQGWPQTEMSNAEIIATDNEYLSVYDVELIDNSSKLYNCHGYAWPTGSGNYICMKSEDVSKFYTDDLFHESNSNNCQVIYYYEGDHSARQYVTDLNGTYISKWAHGPLVKHHYSEVPVSYKASYRKFYSYPYIIGESNSAELNTTYTYTLYPYMSYATYSWDLPDQRETNYEIVSVSENTIQIKFLRNAIFYITCSISNKSTGSFAYEASIEVLTE